MKYTTINARAAAQAMTIVVGEQGRMHIENVYKIIDGAMQDAYAEGYTQAQDTFTSAKQPAFEPVFAEDEAIDWSRTRIRSNDEIGSDSGDECPDECPEECQCWGCREARGED